MTDIPESVLVVGAGAIGVEFVRIFRSLGSAVTVVEMLDRILPGMDGRAAQTLAASMQKKGVRLVTGAAVQKVEIESGGVRTVLANGETVRTEKVLVCIGRAPNSAGLGLEALGVRIEKGFIRTDAMGCTGVPGVYAAGDVAGKWLLAYTAAREAVRAMEHALGRAVPPDDGIVPLTVFSDPEVATVGLSEKEASGMGIDVNVGRFQFAASGKALATGEAEGFAALVAEKSTDRVVGGQVVGPHASDLIAEIALAVRMKVTARDVALTLQSHPTFAECVMEAAHDVHGEAIHMIRKRASP